MNQYRPSGFGMLPPVIKNLLIINILLFAGTHVLASTMGIDLTQYLALYFFKSDFFAPYQFVTHMFLHADLSHIFFNMFALWMFGNVLENYWGGKKFLIYFLVTGVGAALIHTGVNWWLYSHMVETASAFTNTPAPASFIAFVNEYLSSPSSQLYDFINQWSENPENPYFIEQAQSIVQQIVEMRTNIPTIGASGAVFGVLLAFGMMFPNSVLYIYFAIPMKAKYFVILYGVIELVAGVMNQPGDNVAHFAHLGGMIFGFILIKAWKKNQFNRIN